MMSDSPLHEQLSWDTRVLHVAGALLVAVMLACAVASLVQLIENLLPDWEGSVLVVLSFLAALEAVLTQRQLKQKRLFSDEWLLFRMSEIVTMLVVIRLMLFIQRGWEQFTVDWQLMKQDFLPAFFSQDYLLIAFLVMLVWVAANLFANELFRLEVDEKDLDLERTSGISRRDQVRKSLGYMLLVIGVGITTLSAVNFLDAQGSGLSTTWVVINVLGFFLCSLALLSLVEYSIHQVRWHLDGLPTIPGLARRWLQAGLIFLLAILAAVALLPTGYSLGLFDSLWVFFRSLVTLAYILLFIVMLPFILIMILISLLTGGTAGQAVSRMPLAQQVVDVGESAIHGLPWWEVVRSILFWIAFLLVVGFSLYYYFGQNKTWVESLRHSKIAWWLRALGSWLRTALQRTNQGVAQMLRAGLGRLRPQQAALPLERWNILNLRGLSPRQKVLFYYQALVRRAGERGLGRQPGQTPYEYAGTLDNRLPEVQQEIDDLSEHFVEARYTRHTIPPEEVPQVQHSWKNIRQVLRKIRSK